MRLWTNLHNKSLEDNECEWKPYESHSQNINQIFTFMTNSSDQPGHDLLLPTGLLITSWSMVGVDQEYIVEWFCPILCRTALPKISGKPILQNLHPEFCCKASNPKGMVDDTTTIFELQGLLCYYYYRSKYHLLTLPTMTCLQNPNSPPCFLNDYHHETCNMNHMCVCVCVWNCREISKTTIWR